jgi:hypothetical protein
MATVMEIQNIESRPSRRPLFSAIRWGAILGGVVSGTASYLLLSLLGVAVGLTAIDPQSAEPVGRVSLATGIWTGVSMLVGAFIGGYVAGHMSGLSRASDGMLHGFVSWGVTTLLYGVLTVSALGAILGGTFSVMGQVLQTGAETAAQSNGQAGEGALRQLEQLLAGDGGNVEVSQESLREVQQALSAGNRDQAINTMVQDMGIEQSRAEQIADSAAPLLSRNPREVAGQAADALAVTSWWLFIGLLLSLALGIFGGAAGTRATGNRLAGDHVAERQVHIT